MKPNVTLTLRADDAEPILRKAAYEAAKFGAFVDYITRKTYNAPGNYFVMHGQWQDWFLAAKRIVEAFGIEYEPTSEEETLTVHFDYVGGTRHPRKIAGMTFVEVRDSKPDYKHPRPAYRRDVHSQACHAAAERVVKAWRETLKAQIAA